MGGVHVTHLETGPLTGETARPQCAQTSFVRRFRQGVGLVHELAQLTGTEKFLHHRSYRFRVDQVVGHQCIDFLKAHPLLDGAFHSYQPDAIVVLKKLSHRPHPAIAQVIDIIHNALSIPQRHKRFCSQKNIFFPKRSHMDGRIDAQTEIDFESSDTRQVIVIGFEKQVIEKILCDFRCRGISRPKPSIDLDKRFFFGIRPCPE